MRLPIFGLSPTSILRVPQAYAKGTFDSTILRPMWHTALGAFWPCVIEPRTGGGFVIF